MEISPFSQRKPRSQDTELKLKFPMLENKEDAATRSSAEKENQKSKGRENGRVHDEDKKRNQESSPGTEEAKVDAYVYKRLISTCLQF
ncbi:Peptidyl-prolyl cis-trans isomerase G [Myotis davidii]|uniref:Peptidyl-prolyl cis-trans isomerase G n=1 Tax=Myotis davidii TaxID=225400 RepID=L5M557_MYODS|nr:Peptidyl-prolyl cis-trans isomerase G [Myotis davidii]